MPNGQKGTYRRSDDNVRKHWFCSHKDTVRLVDIFFDVRNDPIGISNWVYFQKYLNYISQISFIQKNMFRSITSFKKTENVIFRYLFAQIYL